jgi:hypothetical protein
LHRSSVYPSVVFYFSFFPAAGIFSRLRSDSLLAHLFHFAVSIGAMVVAALFLTLSGTCRVLYDESPVLVGCMA